MIESDFHAFERLYETAFPDTYYNAKMIVNRLDDECILKALKSKTGQMLGYAYFEVDIEQWKKLHYTILLFRQMQKNQGYGTMLLKEVVTNI